MGVLDGKSCLVIGDRNSLFRAVVAELESAGAWVGPIAAPETADAAWRDAVMDKRQGPAKIDAIVSLCLPDAGGGFGKATLNDFRRVLDASYVRNFLALKYGVQVLRAGGGGVFITVTSADGMTGVEGAAPRCAASQGIVLMTRSAAVECAAKDDNVRVNAVMVGDIVGGDSSRQSPGHVTVEDVTSTVAYLVSDAASYLTALILPVANGGPRP